MNFMAIAKRQAAFEVHPKRHPSELGGATYQSRLECLIQGELAQRLWGDKIRELRDWRMPTFAHFEILAVMVDRVQMQQVFMNLMLNAHRSREGLSRRAYGEVGTAGQSTPALGQRQGVGLPVEKMDRIFSAFFTNKPQGSRMGLAITRSIVGTH